MKSYICYENLKLYLDALHGSLDLPSGKFSCEMEIVESVLDAVERMPRLLEEDAVKQCSFVPCKSYTEDGRCRGTKEIDYVNCDGNEDKCIYSVRKCNTRHKVRGFEAVNGQHRRHCTVEPRLPERSTKHSAGYDFFAPVDIVIQPGEIVRVMTDVCAYMQDDEVLMLYLRSSMGKRGIRLSNGTGVVDSDYYGNKDNGGNIGIMLQNNSNATWFAKAGDKIMQGIFIKYLVADNGNCETSRKGGFGSTGS